MELSAKDKEQVTRLINSRFKGYANVRLSKLSAVVLDEIVRVCSNAPLAEDATTEQKVARVLEVKRVLEKELRLQTELSKLRCETPAPPDAPGVPDVSEANIVPAPAAPPELTADPPPDALSTPAIRTPVFRAAHEINLIAFNALKLRLDRKELQDEWDAAVLEFSKYDILMLSEVRASDKLFKARAERLVEMLNDCTEHQWVYKSSEPSGPGVKEVHLVIVKRPISIAAVATLVELDGWPMDHAPIVATLDDPRFLGELRRINVVSVHMPPKSNRERRAQRDAQVRKLTSYYASHAGTRLDTPFSNKGAKDTHKQTPYVAHFIGGDFNADAKELRELGVESHGWEVQLGSVRTSSGGKSYDNWLVNRDCKDHLTVGADILDLTQYANFSRGQQGLSDHAPVTLRIREVPRMQAPVPSKTRAEMRKQLAHAPA